MVRKYRGIIIIAMIIGVFVILAITITRNANIAIAQNIDDGLSKCFMGQEVKETATLYNLDGSSDFILLTFEDGGYAIIARESHELLEYTNDGRFPVDFINNKICYSGPNNYFYDNNGTLINTKSNKPVDISTEQANQLSQDIRIAFSIPMASYDSLLPVDAINIPTSPPLDENNLIEPTEGAKYIDNYDYFFSAPRHGSNNGYSCTTVAIQLLLSYNNYYHDRRIIDNKYLFGTSTSLSNLNPNYCDNPISKNSFTTGSNQSFHDYLYDKDIKSYLTETAKTPLNEYLNDQGISFTLDSIYSFPDALPSNKIVDELDDGRPVVLATTESLNGTPYEGQRAFNHSVIAYGYQKLAPYDTADDTYLGYIVHMGWDNNATGYRTNIWTNSAWYYDALTLKINHVHNYVDDSEGEMDCAECGHRTVKFSTGAYGEDLRITGVNSSYNLSGVLALPALINGENVVAISASAFEGQTGVTGYVLPNSITTIGDKAFAGNSELRHVRIFAESVTINKNVFLGCDKLSSPGLNYDLLPNNTYQISLGDADGNVILIPSEFNGKRVSSIADNGFSDADISYVFIGDGITSIGNAAFLNQSEVESISIPASVAFIGANAFQGCTSLNSITFAEGSLLTTIGNGAFYGCSELFDVTLPEYVTAIGANTFENCTSLGLVRFHENSHLESIGNSAFSGSNLMLSMIIPAGVKTIGANAYQNTMLGMLSFESGSQLTSIGNAAFAGCEMMTYMSLPSGLESLGYDVFSGCVELMSVVIPDSVTSIGGNAFAGCTNLTIYTEHDNPPADWIGGWNSLNRPIVLDCALSDDGAVVSFTKTASNPFNANATGGVMNPSAPGYSFGGWYTTADFSGMEYADIASAPNGTLYAKWNENACVAAGTLITLADGRQVPVESLTGNEMLLVWNLFTGEFDVAPILFIDSEAAGMYEVVTLAFSDGTTLKVIDEHALWDFDLNEYVFMRSDAAKYIGHWFNKQSYDADGNMIYTRVQLTGVTVTTEYTSAWSPVTYGHLCFYVNGMLSMPGATTGLINIFDVDPDTMTIEEEQYLADIAQYGLFTYDEFAALYPVPEEIFDAFGGQYFKVAIGKGILTEEMISALIVRYSEFF